MAKKINRVADPIAIAKQNKLNAESWGFPGHERERMAIPIPGDTVEKVKNQKENKIRRMKQKGYIVIDDVDQIELLWGKSANVYMAGYFDGSVVFMIWQYSQLLKRIDKNRDKFIDAINGQDEGDIMSEVIASKICKCACFVNHLGKEELSASTQLVKRDKDGETILKVVDNIVKGKERRNLDLYDLSLATIKHAIKLIK